MDSCDVLLENAKVMKRHKNTKGIVKTAIAIEMTLGAMHPPLRKKLWDYLSRSRKAIGNKIFEDDMDIAELLISRNLGGGILD